MLNSQNRHPLHGEALPRNTYARISKSIQSLAEREPVEFKLSECFLWAEAELAETVPDQVVGVRTPLGALGLEDGRIDAVWFNETGRALAATALGDEQVAGQLLGQLSFAKHKDGAHLSGDFFLFSNNEVDVRVFSRGPEPDTDLSHEFFAFADKVGADNLWQDAVERNPLVEQHYEGELDPRGGMRLAYALQRLLQTPADRPA